MPTITVEEAQAHLSLWIDRLEPGDEIIITRDQKPVARLTGTSEAASKPLRKLGTMKGSVVSISEDFDAPLDEFLESQE